MNFSQFHLSFLLNLPMHAVILLVGKQKKGHQFYCSKDVLYHSLLILFIWLLVMLLLKD
jgi:hypothetical protein